MRNVEEFEMMLNAPGGAIDAVVRSSTLLETYSGEDTTIDVDFDGSYWTDMDIVSEKRVTVVCFFCLFV